MRCQRADGFGPCEQEAEVRVNVACKHEHVRDVLICARCLAIVRLHPQRCRPCHEADGHACELTVLKVPA